MSKKDRENERAYREARFYLRPVRKCVMREKFSVAVFPRSSSFNFYRFGASYRIETIIAAVPFSTLSWNFNSLLLRAEFARSRQRETIRILLG